MEKMDKLELAILSDVFVTVTSYILNSLVPTGATAATSVAEIENFLSGRQSRQHRRCILFMGTISSHSRRTSYGFERNGSRQVRL